MKKNLRKYPLFLALFLLFACKKTEPAVDMREQVLGYYDVDGRMEYNFSDTPTYQYILRTPSLRLTIHKSSVQNGVNIEFPFYWGTGTYILATHQANQAYNIQNVPATARLNKGGTVVTASVKLNGRIIFIGKEIIVEVEGTDDQNSLGVKYYYKGLRP